MMESAASAALPFNNSSGSILADKRRRASERINDNNNHNNKQQFPLQQQPQQQQVSFPGEIATVAPPAALISESTTTTDITTLPGAIHIPGWRRRRRASFRYHDDDNDNHDGSDSTESTPDSAASASSSSSSPSSSSSSSQEIHEQLQAQQSSIEILSAQLVDEDEMQRHAELLFHQMLSQAAVAELVDEEEIRRQAQEQAAQEILLLQQQQQQQQEKVGEGMLLSITGKQNKRRRRIIFIAARCCIVMAVIVVIIVTITLLLDADAADADASAATDYNNILPITSTILPNSGSTSTLSPVATITPPSSMPTAAASWQQIGNSINGIRDYEQFGYELAFSANGNTVVAAAQYTAGQVRAYTLFHNETATKELSISSSTSTYSSSYIWKPLEPFFITRDATNVTLAPTSNDNDKICLSPNGKFVALIYNDFDTGSRIRIFALTDRSNNDNNNVNMDTTSSNATTTTTNNDSNAANNDSDTFVWEQIGPDILHPSSSFSSSTPGDVMEWIMSASLTDTLILAIGCYTGGYFNPGSDQGTVYVYQWNDADNSNSTWIRMGQEIQLHAWSIQLVLVQNNSTSSSSSSASTFATTRTLILAVGGRSSARTFRYEPDMDSWTQFGSELAVDNDDDDNDINDINVLSGVGVMLSLSMTDAKTLIVGLINDAAGQGIGLLRTYLYDAATDDWIQLDQDLKDSTFLFGQSFALSGNGKMLVTTTQELGAIVQSGEGWVTGQIRTWDFIGTADDQVTGNGVAYVGAGGKWIQRGAALEVGSLESGFGFKIALSEDGNRLATSAIRALNEQGVQSGKVRVYEQY